MGKGCYHSVKDNKSESKSQHNRMYAKFKDCCYHSVKDNKSESKSQRGKREYVGEAGCYHSVKDNKSESKSQRSNKERLCYSVVIILSKIINLKANHNGVDDIEFRLLLLSFCQR